MGCLTSSAKVQARPQIVSYSSHGQKAIKLLELSQNSSLFAQQNTDDFYLNDVTLWVQIRDKKQTQYFQISKIPMYEYALPKVQINRGALVIEATTLTVDPEEENELRKVPTLEGRLYQTIRLGSIDQQGLKLNTLTCQ